MAFGCTNVDLGRAADNEVPVAPVGPLRSAPRSEPRIANLEISDAKDRTQIERALLPHTVHSPPFILRTALPPHQHARWLDRLKAVERAFFQGPGAAATTPIDPDTRPWTVIIFDTPSAYRAYMDKFIGFGSDSGGVFLEGSATLYTFDRPPEQNNYTLRELLQHELTHALASRYVFAGTWTDNGYHEQSKGWLDEGLAEMMAGLTDDLSARFEHRAVVLDQLCARPLRPLFDLLASRRGYDRAGTFDYASAWSFVYYLYHFRRDALDRVITSFRHDQFRLKDFEAIAQTAIPELEQAWHRSIQTWCEER